MKRTILASLFCYALASCNEDQSPDPVINSIFPVAEGVGAQVLIHGSNFGSSIGEATVDFNGAAGSIDAISDTLITTRVPEGATTGRISVTARGQVTTSADVFEVLIGRWEQRAEPPFAIRFYAVAFVIKGVGYIGTGVDPPVPLKDFYAYDPSVDHWIRKADIPVARYHAVSFVVGDKAYVGLGRNEEDLADFYEYDPETDQWKQVADFPAGPRQTATAFSIGGKGYVGLGRTGALTSEDKLNKDVWIYDPVPDTWSQAAEFGGVARERAIGVSIDGKGYAGLGGYANFHDFWQFDPVTGTWSALLANPSEPNLMWDITAFVLGDRVYVLGGHSKNCVEYDVTTNQWQRRTPIPASFGGGNAFSVGNFGFVVTGALTSHCKLWRFELR